MTVYSVKKPPSSNQNMVQGSPFQVPRYLASLEGGSPSSQLLHLRGRGWLWWNITPTAETIFPVMRGSAQVLTVTPPSEKGSKPVLRNVSSLSALHWFKAQIVLMEHRSAFLLHQRENSPAWEDLLECTPWVTRRLHVRPALQLQHTR